ncbi:MAG TPA: sulfatase-like hydrolase/transferase [Clostridiales bacterium]|nr:sulfatase-like hydrolase/transferase [Clostridiales bacterium]
MNVVFFFPDEMRAKSLSCYGNQYVKTPNFDRLASEGTLFENNYTTHPVCVASRCSLMTGWYPHVEGFRTLRYFLQTEHPNFMRYLKQAGYETHIYGKNHMFSDEVYAECVDFSQELQYDLSVMSKKKVLPEDTKDYKMYFDPLPDGRLEEISDTKCVNEAVEVIKNYKQGDKPFFIFLPTFYPHAPYFLTEQYQNMYDPGKLPPCLPPDLENKPEFQELIRKYRELGDTDEMVFRKIHAVYLGMCTYSDMLFGRVLDAIDATGLSEDTIVVFSSDHGDWAGDYGLVEKWPNAFDDDITKVPLIVRVPGYCKGHRVKELTQTFDIFPTLFEILGIDICHDQFGISLKQQLQGAAGDPQRTVYCEGGYDTREPHAFEGSPKYSMFMQEGSIYYPKMMQQIYDRPSCCRGTMLRNSKYKLNIRTNGENELYDMEEDPDEKYNLYYKAEYRDIICGLKDQMLTWLIHTSDVIPWENHI